MVNEKDGGEEDAARDAKPSDIPTEVRAKLRRLEKIEAKYTGRPTISPVKRYGGVVG